MLSRDLQSTRIVPIHHFLHRLSIHVLVSRIEGLSDNIDVVTLDMGNGDPERHDMRPIVGVEPLITICCCQPASLPMACNVHFP